jgi:hypothetical protein
MTDPNSAQRPADAGATTTVKDGNRATAMPLKDFMSQLGVVMKLPDKDRPRATRPEAAVDAAPNRRSTPRLWLPVVAILGAAGFAGARMKPPPRVTLPPEVIGTWVTPHPEFAGRRLIFTPAGMLQVNDTTIDSPMQKILGSQVKRYADTVQVAIVHEADGGSITLSLAYTRGAFESLTLKNPAGVAWYRITDSAAFIPGFRQGKAPGSPILPGGRKPWEH